MSGRLPSMHPRRDAAVGGIGEIPILLSGNLLAGAR
jgi:hypothetical protein